MASKRLIPALIASLGTLVPTSTLAQPAQDLERPPIVAPEIEQVVFSVADLARSQDAYGSILGFDIQKRGEKPGHAFARLWKLPAGTQVNWVLMQPPVPHAVQIRLVAFEPQLQRSRYEYRWQDPGLNDIHLCVPDVRRFYRNLSDKGFTALQEPVMWGGRGGDFGIGEPRSWAVFMHGFDGEGVTLVEPVAAADGVSVLGSFCTSKAVSSPGAIRDVVLTVADKAETYAFYHGVLGWKVEDQWESFGPDMERMLRVPRGTVARTMLLRHPEQIESPGIAVIEVAGAKAMDIRARSMPPYRGFVALTFRTNDLDALYERVVRAGASVVLPPIQIADEPYASRGFSVRGPAGEFLEFVERPLKHEAQ